MAVTSPHLLSTVLGRVLAGGVAGLSRLRSTEKPMHPRGSVATASLRRYGGAVSGAAFLDTPGRDDVLVRTSRSVGLPAPWPDVDGLAVRVPTDDGGHADVLLSGTGRGRVTRYLLAPARHARTTFLGCLVPFRSPSGPVLLGADPTADGGWDLSWARPWGSWHRFATLEPYDGRHGSTPGDAPVAFDPVSTAPDGLEVYPWHRRIRGPGYAAARRSRSQEHRATPDLRSGVDA